MAKAGVGFRTSHDTDYGALVFKAPTGGITEVLQVTATGFVVPANGITSVFNGALSHTGGNFTSATGDVRVTAGNVRLGAIETFFTTEPTSAVVMKEGTAPAGAITTSGAIFSSATVVRKIIAAGTVSNVET